MTLRQINEQHWRDRAACLGSDTDIFFPAPKGGRISSRANVQKAKSICTACPVKVECLEYAVDTYQMLGIWGGKTSMERRADRRAAGGGVGRPPLQSRNGHCDAEGCKRDVLAKRLCTKHYQRALFELRRLQKVDLDG